MLEDGLFVLWSGWWGRTLGCSDTLPWRALLTFSALLVSRRGLSLVNVFLLVFSCAHLPLWPYCPFSPHGSVTGTAAWRWSRRSPHPPRVRVGALGLVFCFVCLRPLLVLLRHQRRRFVLFEARARPHTCRACARRRGVRRLPAAATASASAAAAWCGACCSRRVRRRSQRRAGACLPGRGGWEWGLSSPSVACGRRAPAAPGRRSSGLVLSTAPLSGPHVCACDRSRGSRNGESRRGERQTAAVGWMLATDVPRLAGAGGVHAVGVRALPRPPSSAAV